MKGSRGGAAQGAETARRLLAGAGALALLWALGACGDRHKGEAPAPEVLRFGAIPDQAPERVRAQHAGVVREACALAGLRCELRESASYESLLDELGAGVIDVAFLGGGTFALARHRHQVEPLVMRDIDLDFTAVVLARAHDPARALADLRGRRFSFGNRLSGSGHVTARRLLGLEGVEPERDYASVVYSGAQDATMRLIAGGQVDGGAVNSSVYFKALSAGDPVARSLRVLWQSPPFIDYVWVARRELPAALRERLRDAFLDLDLAAPAQREALAAEDARGYVPAYVGDFDGVVETMRQRGEL